MSTLADEFILQLAQEKGLLCADRLAAARERVARVETGAIPPTRIVDLLVSDGALARAGITGLLAEKFGLPVVDLSNVAVDPAVLALVPRVIALRQRLIPLARKEEVLRVAISDPLDTEGADLLAHLLNLEIETVVAPTEEIIAAIERLYPREEGSLEQSFAEAPSDDEPLAQKTATTLESHTADAPIIKLVHALIAGAVYRRASDIHLEPLEKRFRVRYRVDGVLHETENPAKALQLAIVSRLKIMANISIAEKRLPQDGRIQIMLGDRAVDLRVSSLPTAHGESIVMRILDQAGLQLGLPELGFLADDQATLERLIAQPDGIVLVTGPTGSGKTTTLYSCLHHLNRSHRKIITVEDPVEYQLNGINQVPVRHEIGMTFASALRAMLRQAPNIVMIGEIRDQETAEIAINASLTGHMVFSTLHTNDAPGAVTRLIDIGVKPFLVATSLRATMAQRLIRKICESCRRLHTPTAAEAEALGLDPARFNGAAFARGKGCSACHGTGYRGRMGIFEIFLINEEIQRMIYERASAAQLRDKARALGMRTMREDGARKVSAGLTTIEEVVSITVGDPS